MHLDGRSLEGVNVSASVLTRFAAGIAPGADANVVAVAFDQHAGVRADVRGQHEDVTAFAIIDSVVVGLTVVVTSVAALCMFNTVVLSTRHLAIHNAVRMEPRQVVTMVVAATAVLGLIAGGSAIPLGVALHRNILSAMADIAGTDIPATFYDVYHWTFMPVLALGGVVIAALGATVPARWTARQPVSDVLHAE